MRVSDITYQLGFHGHVNEKSCLENLFVYVDTIRKTKKDKFINLSNKRNTNTAVNHKKSAIQTRTFSPAFYSSSINFRLDAAAWFSALEALCENALYKLTLTLYCSSICPRITGFQTRRSFGGGKSADNMRQVWCYRFHRRWFAIRLQCREIIAVNGRTIGLRSTCGLGRCWRDMRNERYWAGGRFVP